MRLIDADELARDHCKDCSLDVQNSCKTDPVCASLMWIVNAPTVDAEPVRHGKWIVENEESIRCSECCFNRANIKMPLDYCPKCGAKMDGD